MSSLPSASFISLKLNVVISWKYYNSKEKKNIPSAKHPKMLWKVGTINPGFCCHPYASCYAAAADSPVALLQAWIAHRCRSTLTLVMVRCGRLSLLNCRSAFRVLKLRAKVELLLALRADTGQKIPIQATNLKLTSGAAV